VKYETRDVKSEMRDVRKTGSPFDRVIFVFTSHICRFTFHGFLCIPLRQPEFMIQKINQKL